MDDRTTAPTGDDRARIAAWFSGRLPERWTSTAPADVVVDRDEITVTLTLEAPGTSGDADDATRAEAADGRAAGFREDTREERVAIAREAEHRFERKVAWSVRIDDRTIRYSHLAVPVMTRLRQPERLVLDTLVDAGVARSRADAVAWCVRLVGQHTDDWLARLRDAMADVERIRAEGPGAG